MNSQRHQAEKLREAGYSYSMISKSLLVPQSTLSSWFRGKPYVPNEEVRNRMKSGPLRSGQLSRAQKIKDQELRKQQGKKEVGSLTKRDLLMLGLGLYIGEGAKTIEQIRISNSDPLIIALAVRWLKTAFDLSEDNLTIRVHIYPDNDEITAKTYWSQVTDLPLKNFRKTMIDQRVNKKAVNRNKLAHGTAHISVVSNGDPEKGVVLARKIQGWMEAALNQV